MAALPGCRDAPIVIGSPSPSREPSQSLDASDDQSCNLPEITSDAESEYMEDDIDDDEEEEEDREDLASYERSTIKMEPTLQQDEQEPHNSSIFVPGVEDMDGDFWHTLREYMVLVDVYPSVKHGNSLQSLCKQLFNVPQGQRIRITRVVQYKIAKAAADWRSRLSRAIKDVMQSYTFDATNLHEICKTNRKRQFKYMMDAMRFARKDYLSSGAILQSGALGDVIAKVFYHERSGIGFTLDDDALDGKVPRPVIALTFVFMYVEMSFLCTKKHDLPSWSGPGIGTARASLYRSALQGVFENGETVDWDQVQRVQTQHVHEKLQGCQVACPFPSGPLSASYQPKYQDGEYVSDSDDN
ncbi:predicted protein [Lichtheimia corymbifera JMRC:FSU:9682]|uniref:DUF6532 domain-containing protein n=1 Tax=Lichtheimia corymbifera JMRC:FSU:9682 TaxID=1263082 RepID=A0A068S5L5_9FUNG|nr:predicted protein [Lichtheimia corymbifera JMRC:FSU:9682]